MHVRRIASIAGAANLISRLALGSAIWHLSFAISSAHPADVTHLLVKVGPSRLEFRFTFNLYTLRQITPLDTNGDAKVSKAEIDAAEPAFRDFLLRHTLVTINETDTDLGEARPFDCLWPKADTTEITDAEMPQRSIDLVFVKPWPSVVEDVWLGFDFFDRLSELHSIQAVYQQDGGFHEVSFSLLEPEYLYDTGYTAATVSPSQPPTTSPPAKAIGLTASSLIAGFLLVILIAILLRKTVRSRSP